MASGSTAAQRRLLRQHIRDLSLPCKPSSALVSIPGLEFPTFISPLTTQNNGHHDVSPKKKKKPQIKSTVYSKAAFGTDRAIKLVRVAGVVAGREVQVRLRMAGQRCARVLGVRI